MKKLFTIVAMMLNFFNILTKKDFSSLFTIHSNSIWD